MSMELISHVKVQISDHLLWMESSRRISTINTAQASKVTLIVSVTLINAVVNPAVRCVCVWGGGILKYMGSNSGSEHHCR